MKRSQLTTVVLGACLLLVSAIRFAGAADLRPSQFGLEDKGGKGSLQSPHVYVGNLKDFDQRSYKFSKRITCMRKGYQYIIKVKSYDFKPRLFLRQLDDSIVARGQVNSYEEKTSSGTWTVYENELRYLPKHDGYILEISHYGDDAEAPRAFSLFVYKLPLNNRWGDGGPDFPE